MPTNLKGAEPFVASREATYQSHILGVVRPEGPAGRLVEFWKEEFKGGKVKTLAVFMDGEAFQNVLTAEAWSARRVLIRHMQRNT